MKSFIKIFASILLIILGNALNCPRRAYLIGVSVVTDFCKPL